MFAEFLNIIFKSIKLDKTLYKDNRNFGEAAIYFAGLIIILGGISGAIAANTVIKTPIAMIMQTAIKKLLVIRMEKEGAEISSLFINFSLLQLLLYLR